MDHFFPPASFCLLFLFSFLSTTFSIVHREFETHMDHFFSPASFGLLFLFSFLSTTFSIVQVNRDEELDKVFNTCFLCLHSTSLVHGLAK